MTILTMITKMSEGLGRTCAIFFLTLLFSLPLGLIVSLLRMSRNKVVSSIMKVYISVLRGTPLMLQLLAVTYGPYYLFGINVSREKLIPVVIAFSLNYAAYFAEIYRGGIESMSLGQYEAAEVLGYTKFQCFIRIILPQVIKRILPSVTNEIVTLVKDTSMAFTVAYQEMFGEGHLHGVYRGLSGDVHHRQADREFPDQFHALCDRRCVLFPVQRNRGLGHGTV